MGYELWLSNETGLRRKGTSLKEVHENLNKNFKVDHICETLFCTTLSCNLSELQDEMRKKNFDVVGVRQEELNTNVGFVISEELNSESRILNVREFTAENTISKDLSIFELILSLRDSTFKFVENEGGIENIITRSDINKPIARIPLFALISLLEMHLNFWIARLFESEKWKSYLNAKRLLIFNNNYEEKKNDDNEISMIECLQLADKKTIFSKFERLNIDFGISVRKFQKLMKRVEKLRNRIAHSQNSIISNLNWNDLTFIVEETLNFLNSSESKLYEESKKNK